MTTKPRDNQHTFHQEKIKSIAFTYLLTYMDSGQTPALPAPIK